MGLFTKKISISSLDLSEKAAATAALEVAQSVDKRGELKKELSSALSGMRNGKMTEDDIKVTIACLLAALKAVTDGDDPTRSSELENKRIAQVSMAKAIQKLKNLL